MKSNVKKFLSTMCVLASALGAFAPSWAKASSDHEKYGADFSDASAVPAPAAPATPAAPVALAIAPAVPDEIINELIRLKHEIDKATRGGLYLNCHQNFYNLVLKLEKEGTLTLFSAFMTLMYGQTRQLSDDEIKELLATGCWSDDFMVNFYNRVEGVYDMRFAFNNLEREVMRLFDCLFGYSTISRCCTCDIKNFFNRRRAVIEEDLKRPENSRFRYAYGVLTGVLKDELYSLNPERHLGTKFTFDFYARNY